MSLRYGVYDPTDNSCVASFDLYSNAVEYAVYLQTKYGNVFVVQIQKPGDI